MIILLLIFLSINSFCLAKQSDTFVTYNASSSMNTLSNIGTNNHSREPIYLAFWNQEISSNYTSTLPAIQITEETLLFIPTGSKTVIQPESYNTDLIGNKIKDHYSVSMVIYGIIYLMVNFLI